MEIKGLFVLYLWTVKQVLTSGKSVTHKITLILFDRFYPVDTSRSCKFTNFCNNRNIIIAKL